MQKIGYNIEFDCNTSENFALHMKSQTRTSIVVTSYNHEKYIRRCLDSILMQKAFFDIEIIVGDDCSQDGTPEIILEYVNKYPDIVKKIQRSKNVGMLQNIQDCVNECSGAYIAFCEADDYWISDRYLYKKMEIMKSDKEIGMCFNWLLLNIEDNSSYVPHDEQGRLSQGPINFSELMSKPLTANFSCCFYNRDALLSVPGSFYLRESAADWLLNLYIAEKYKVYFMKETLSVYTIHSKGQWSGMDPDEQLKQVDNYRKEFSLIFGNHVCRKKLKITRYIGQKRKKIYNIMLARSTK